LIGVLALQGAFQKHLDCLALLKVEAKPIRTLLELRSCDALILPGGESTAHHRLMGPEFWAELKAFSKPMFGTCCGLILLAAALKDDAMPTIGALDITVSRNAYGSQIESFETEVSATLLNEKHLIKGCFIRAPQIVEVGAKAQILASYQNQPVLVEQGNVLGCAFHPEIFYDLTLHRYFLTKLACTSLRKSQRIG